MAYGDQNAVSEARKAAIAGTNEAFQTVSSRYLGELVVNYSMIGDLSCRTMPCETIYRKENER